MIERPGEVDRFDMRIAIRFDGSLLAHNDFDKLEKINDALYETLHTLEEKLKEVFGSEFLLDDSSPFLCGPRRSPQGVVEFFVVVGSDFFKRKRKGL